MKTAFVQNGKILSISSSAAKPSGEGWIVLSDDFKGKIGDTVSAAGAVVYETDGVTPEDAIKAVRNAEKELAKAESARAKAKENFEAAEKSAKVAVQQATDATNARNAAYASLIEAEKKWKDFSHAILEKKDAAKRVVDKAIERAGDEAAKKAKEDAEEKARAEIEGKK
jgi:colicin import membrane protein